MQNKKIEAKIVADSISPFINPWRKPKKDLSGKVFGKLTVVKYWKDSKWICICSCGKITHPHTSDLNNGNSKGCRSCQNRLNEKTQAGLNILYGKYKRRAYKYGREFELSLDEFKIITSSDCHYCGLSPNKTIKQSKHVSFNTIEFGTYTYNGIDRKDSSIGYTLENSIPCCEICNKAKRDIPYDIFINYIKRLIKYNETTN